MILRACPRCGRLNETPTCPEHQLTGSRGSTREWRRLRGAVIERDGNCCTVADCGASDNLEVHHCDGDPSNNDLRNLTTLCEDHHLEAEGRRRRR